MKDFNNKLIYITGGSGGIGFAVAKEFLVEGASVLLIARDEQKLKTVKNRLIEELSLIEQQRIHICSADISDYKKVTSILKIKMETVGVPDVLINGAGIAYPNYFDRIPHDIFVKTININLIGTWNVISAIVPLMKERGGYLVNISSMAGYVGVFGYAAYSASKFGIIGYSEVLKGELKPYGIDVSVLCPPDTDTPQLAEEEVTKPKETRAISGNVKIMRPEAVAKNLLKGIRKKRFMILPGFMNKLSFLMKRLFPWLVFMIMDSDIKKVQKKIKEE